jgi:rhamnosyltransferase
MRGPGLRSQYKIAGVVVLYNPTEDVLANIASYLDQLDILYVVDNSAEEQSGFVGRLLESGKIVYVSEGKNLGIARALNIGAKEAVSHNCDFLLTMDQDSRAAPDMVNELLQCLNGRDRSQVGIIAPFLVTKPGQGPVGEEGCWEVRTVMTSGNLLNLKAYGDVGPFLDELFIDFVDIEYCLRLNSKGYKVIQSSRTILRHNVGQKMKYSFFGMAFYLTNHMPLRKYYKTRNRIYVADIYHSFYPDFFRYDRIRFCLELLRLLLFEPDKWAKFRMVRRGWLDARRGRMGKYKAKP